MSNFAYQLNSFQCGYAGIPVLEIPRLEIPKGKLIFIIGLSGGGKSTLLESLGLMNKTIMDGSHARFFADQNEEIDLLSIWNNEEALDRFRRIHYSFIFQKTNLMSNFSCGENMILPALSKGIDYHLAKDKALALMERLKLRPQIFEESINEVSGGQRQRIAFIRAMVADFSVMFGDEPTGNLDPVIATELLDVLSAELQKNGKTGLIVSHDLHLAATFADVIVPITVKQRDGRYMGTIDVHSICTRTDLHSDIWLRNGIEIDSHQLALKTFLQS